MFTSSIIVSTSFNWATNVVGSVWRRVRVYTQLAVIVHFPSIAAPKTRHSVHVARPLCNNGTSDNNFGGPK